MKSIAYLIALLAACSVLTLIPGNTLRAQPAAGSTETAQENDAGTSAENDEENADENADDAADNGADKDTDKSAAEDADSTDEKADESDSDASDADADESEAADKKSTTKADEKKQAAKKKRKTHKVKPDHMRVEVELDGAFVAREMSEVALRPEVWSTFEISEVVEHGSHVHEGQMLIKFDDQKLNDAIADLELDLHLSDLSIRRMEQELPRLEKTLQLAVDEAERVEKQVRQDYERFKTLEQAFYEKMVEYTVKGSKFSLDDAVEELKQLEKMYEADDLTEETEEIVLQRQRNAVDMAEFYVEDAEFYREGILNVTLPRMETRMQNAVELAALNVERAKMAQSIDMSRARYELEKRKMQQDQARQRHAKLLSDRALMEIKSPADGIIYFGRCIDGRWPEMSSLINKLQPFGTASPKSVLMTIVKSRPLYITATVDEADRPALEKDQPAKVQPPPKHSKKLAAKVTNVSLAPVSSTKFRVELELAEKDLPEWIVAGMTCDVNVTTYEKKDALVVPTAAVHTDEDDEEQHFVWIVDPDDQEAKPERRNVKVGKRDAKNIEILEGLEAGDVISLEDEKKNEKNGQDDEG